MLIKTENVSSFEDWKKISNPLISDFGEMKIITSQNITIGRVEINEVMEMDAHKHPQEQVTIVVEGSMDIQYNGEKKVVKAGETCIIPKNSLHKVWITQIPFKSFDIFSPVKDDFVVKALKHN